MGYAEAGGAAGSEIWGVCLGGAHKCRSGGSVVFLASIHEVGMHRKHGRRTQSSVRGETRLERDSHERFSQYLWLVDRLARYFRDVVVSVGPIAARWWFIALIGTSSAGPEVFWFAQEILRGFAA
jgi:hypothetical protein